ncbi:DUF2523 domain-containing protein [Aquitalea aquatilis]|uniref:DUF2523 domain-containing protein n=1 Tax=Aquitalea aquatilis TaxID=1537400 RepID=UPI0010BD1D8D|nr:DUF2523 domain-containing protein [Aquitalea aquatilis]
MTNFFQNCWNFLVACITALKDMLFDVFVMIFKLILNLILFVVNMLSLPVKLGGGLNSLFTGMDSSIMWLLGACGLGAGLSLIGAGYVFRLTRKVLTLFQW